MIDINQELRERAHAINIQMYDLVQAARASNDVDALNNAIGALTILEMGAAQYVQTLRDSVTARELVARLMHPAGKGL